MPHQRRHIANRFPVFDALQKLSSRSPVPIQLAAGENRRRILLQQIQRIRVHRRRRQPAVADGLGGNALQDLALFPRRLEQHRIRMAVNIHKSRRYRQTGGLHPFGGFLSFQISNRRNFSVQYPDIGAKSVLAAAIDDFAIFYQHIEHGPLSPFASSGNRNEYN